MFSTQLKVGNFANCLLFDCHDDIAYEIQDGPVDELMFTWLGTLQYIHIKSGLPNYFRVPRVVLISRQFALSTAMDASNVPDGFALGNVVFGDYERDEQECGMTNNDLADGATCSPAILWMPIADVLLHPEFKHFHVKNSIALLKLLVPLRSQYMLPGCLPCEDHVINSHGKFTKEKLFLLDFTSDVPRDFYEEEREVTTISLLPRELCYLYNTPWANLKEKFRSREVCSTGCGFHSGAPIMVHESTGHWTVVALAIGGSPCSDPLRYRRPPSPSSHILVYPYVKWITQAITGKPVGAFNREDPFGYVMPRASNISLYNLVGHGWVGHWWMGGLRCHDRGKTARFVVIAPNCVIGRQDPIVWITITDILKIVAPLKTLIICAKVGMPYRLGQPKVWDLDSGSIQVSIPLMRLRSQYKIQVEAWGYNSSDYYYIHDDTSSTESKDDISE